MTKETSEKEFKRILSKRGELDKQFIRITSEIEEERYNPFKYIHNDGDVKTFVAALIGMTTRSDKQCGDPFWENSETALLTAMVAYLHHYTTKNCHTISNMILLIKAADRIGDTAPTDYIFEEVEKYDPESFAVKQYNIFKINTETMQKNVLISCLVRLQEFELENVK